jgi:hypothetical protein
VAIVVNQVSWAPAPRRKKIYEMVDEIIANLGLDQGMNRSPNTVCDRARDDLGMRSAGRIGAHAVLLEMLARFLLRGGSCCVGWRDRNTGLNENLYEIMERLGLPVELEQ